MIRKLCRSAYLESDFWFRIFRPVKLVWDFRRRLIPERIFLHHHFRNALGYDLDLNNPQTLNQKLNWLKVYDRRDVMTRCADKLAVRDYIAEIIGNEYLVPLVYRCDSAADITPEKINGAEFVIKTTHDSGGVYIVRDRNEIDWFYVRRLFDIRLSQNFYYQLREWQYKNIKPQIIVETLLKDDKGEIPNDYKLHCVNGKVAFVQVDTNRHKRHQRNLYDLDWNLLDFDWIYESGPAVSRPEQLSILIALAEKLAVDFDFVRVDFFVVQGRIYFGEITFHPEGGFGKIEPRVWDERIGRQLLLTKRTVNN